MTRARQRQAAAKAEAVAAERVVLALTPARFWLQRTVAGVSHHPLVGFDTPEPDDSLVLKTQGLAS